MRVVEWTTIRLRIPPPAIDRSPIDSSSSNDNNHRRRCSPPSLAPSPLEYQNVKMRVSLAVHVGKNQGGGMPVASRQCPSSPVKSWVWGGGNETPVVGGENWRKPKRWVSECIYSIKFYLRDTTLKLPYPHGQFRTQVPNNYFNYCKAILQLQQYFNQLWAVV